MTSDQNSIRFEWIDTDLLKPSNKPLRNHNRAQRRKYAKLHKLAGGQLAPIVVSPNYEIVDGHLIYDYLKENGIREAYVAVLMSATPADIKALRIFINRLPQDSRWNATNLREAFVELIEISYDLDQTGFDPPEFEAILDLDCATANTCEDADEIPEVQDRAVSKVGDIFDLGNL